MAAASFATTTTTAATSFSIIRLEIRLELTGHGNNVGLVSFNKNITRHETADDESRGTRDIESATTVRDMRATYE